MTPRKTRAIGAGSHDATELAAGKPLPLRRNRDFRNLWIGQATSELGSSVSSLALPLLVLATTRSVALTGLVGTLTFAIGWVMQLPAGYIADRHSRKKVMLICEGVRGAAQMFLVAAIFTHTLRMWMILVSVVISNAAWTFFGPAQIRAIRAIVLRNEIKEATAVNMARGYATGLAGPLLSGALFTAGQAIPFLLDSASFAVSAASVARIRGKLGTSKQRTLPTAALAEIRIGWRYVWHHPFLRSMMLYSAGSNFVATALIFGIILVAGGQSGSGTPIGAALSVASVGGVLGAAIAPWVQRHVKVRQTLLFTGTARVILIAAFARTTQPIILGGLLAAFLMLAPTASTALAAIRTEITPPDLLGRVSSSITFVATGLQPLAPLSVGLMLTHAGHTLAMLVLGSIMMLIVIYVHRATGFKDHNIGTDQPCQTAMHS
jgi:MFS family permease